MSKHLTVVDLKKIISMTGLILHVPGFMALSSIFIALFFREMYAILPLLITGVCSFAVGQLLYRSCKCKGEPSLWSSMAIAALSWLLCPLIAALPFYWICSLAKSHGFHPEAMVDLTRPINAIFESFSGFTGTGLTLVTHPSEYSNSILWWRSLTQWVGGIGLIVFMVCIVNGANDRYNLYYAESRAEVFGKSLKETGKTIFGLYVIYTFLSILLFLIAKMPLWEAINHAMCGISTGGYGMKDDSFASYSHLIKIAAILIMLAGSISFVVHYHMLRLGNYKMLYRSLPHRFLILFFLLGSLLVFLLAKGGGVNWSFIDSSFTVISALSTTGWSVVDISVHTPPIKIFLLFAMVIGGSAGSTAGGLKIQRFLNLFGALNVRLKSILEMRSSHHILKKRKAPIEPSEEMGLELPGKEQTRKLFSSSLLFFLWIFSMLFGWFFLSLELPEEKVFNALFDSISSISNVGLSTNIVSPSLGTFELTVFSFLMWIGKVEIVPIMVLFLSFIERFYQPRELR